MTTGEAVNIAVQSVGVLGTLSLAVLVIYGDRITSWLNGPRLTVEIDSPRGAPFAANDGTTRICYFLKVVNRRPSALATNCQVRLKKLWKKVAKGIYAEAHPPYPLVLTWPPSEYTPPTMSVRRDEPVDLGSIAEGKPFVPSVRWRPNNFDGALQAGETLQYGFEVVCDNFVSSQIQVFEVSWDGLWSMNPDEMVEHLQIRKVAG